MRAHHTLFVVMLAIVLLLGCVSVYAENIQWNESRQFEQYVEKTAPEAMRFIWATHISVHGLEVQLAVGMVHKTFLDEQNFYRTISELWKKSEFVKTKKYSGKVEFMLLDKPLRTLD